MTASIDEQNRVYRPPNASDGGGERGEAHRRPPVYAALDLGTNNCRLLMARPEGRGFKVVDAFSRIIRLGEGVQLSGRLSEAAMARTIEALKVCTDKMARREVRRSRLIATEACRLAENGKEFIDRVYGETGLRLEVVSRETEAQLAVAGCSALLDPSCRSALVFDIGGGSSELMLVEIDARTRRAEGAARGPWHRIVSWTSLPVGVVTLAERYGGIDITRSLFERMVDDVAADLAPFASDCAAAGVPAPAAAMHLLGTSGTVTTIAGVHLGLRRYDRARVDGCWLTRGDAVRTCETLLAMDYAGRVRSPCVGRERADLVLAGCAILEAIMRAWPSDRLRVADRGLREGILNQLMSEDGYLRPRRRRGRRRRSRSAGAEMRDG